MSAAKKLEAPAPEVPTVPAPDGTKPIALEYYYLPYNLGATVQHQIMVGQQMTDGCHVSGTVKTIMLYPGGFAVAEVHSGLVPGRLPSEQKIEVHHLVLTGGHGKVKR